LDDAWWEDFLRELDQLERGVGCEGRGLDDDGVSGEDGGGDLANGEEEREVPLRKPVSGWSSGMFEIRALTGQMAPTTPNGTYLVVIVFSSSSYESSGSSSDAW